MDLHYCPVFHLTPRCHQPPMHLSGLSGSPTKFFLPMLIHHFPRISLSPSFPPLFLPLLSFSYSCSSFHRIMPLPFQKAVKSISDIKLFPRSCQLPASKSRDTWASQRKRMPRPSNLGNEKYFGFIFRYMCIILMEIPKIIFSVRLHFLTIETGSEQGELPNSCEKQLCCQLHLWYSSSGNAITVFQFLFLNMVTNM